MGSATPNKLNAADKKLLDKPFWKMTSTEREAEAEVFSRVGLEDTRALTPAEQKRWARARKPGRPKVGRGAVRVPFSMEFGLLEALDAFARARGLTRSALIAAAVREYMKRAGPARGKAAAKGPAHRAHGAYVSFK